MGRVLVLIGFNNIQKHTWHHLAKFKTSPPPPTQSLQNQVPGGSHLARVVVSLILRFVVLTYMGFFAHDLAKPTHLLSNMECQPQRDPISDFSLEQKMWLGQGGFNLMFFMTGQHSSSRGS